MYDTLCCLICVFAVYGIYAAFGELKKLLLRISAKRSAEYYANDENDRCRSCRCKDDCGAGGHRYEEKTNKDSPDS